MNTIDPKDQTRSSSESSFFRMAANSTKIDIPNGTLAKRIIFDRKRACAVIINNNGAEYTLRANKEVVLPAGAVSIPSMMTTTIDIDAFAVPITSNANGFGHRTCRRPQPTQHSRRLAPSRRRSKCVGPLPLRCKLPGYNPDTFRPGQPFFPSTSNN